MKIYVARHGRTNYNDLGLCNADPTKDVHLTAVGLEQVKRLATRLQSVQIDQIFVAELKRTQQTADSVNRHHQAPVQVEARLNDIRTGYEGRAGSEYFAALDSSDDRWSAHFNDGESLNDMNERVRDFLKELQQKDYEAVLIVTSEFIVRVIYAALNNLSYQEAWDLQVEQASCIELTL